jgi:hypothetical protein
VTEVAPSISSPNVNQGAIDGREGIETEKTG